MEQLFNLVVQNGIGVGSFIALLYFMNTSLNNIKSNTEEITKTLILIQGNLNSLTQRVEIMENKVNAVFLAEPISDFIAVTSTLITFFIVFKKTIKKISNLNKGSIKLESQRLILIEKIIKIDDKIQDNLIKQ